MPNDKFAALVDDELKRMYLDAIRSANPLWRIPKEARIYYHSFFGVCPKPFKQQIQDALKMDPLFHERMRSKLKWWWRDHKLVIMTHKKFEEEIHYD